MEVEVVVVWGGGGGGRLTVFLLMELVCVCVCVAVGGDGAYLHHALWKSAVEAASVACGAQVHHQVRMLSVVHQLSLKRLG